MNWLTLRTNCNYLRQGGCVMPGVCLYVCLSVGDFTLTKLLNVSW